MKLKFAPMTPEEAGHKLRQLAELTALNSRNWENMEQIFTQFITDAYKGGQETSRTQRDALVAALRKISALTYEFDIGANARISRMDAIAREALALAES
jgi:hypothetical protein